MAYSTETNVKQEAGFADNANIATATVTRHISAGDSIIDGVVGKIYTLPLSETPAVIEKISRLLAAGSLMLEEYGTEAEGTSKDGKAKIDEANKLLAMISNKEIQLVKTDGSEMGRSEKVELSGFPDDDTGTDKTTTADKDDPPITEIGMQF